MFHRRKMNNFQFVYMMFCTQQCSVTGYKNKLTVPFSSAVVLL